jgi:hypothetical protein
MQKYYHPIPDIVTFLVNKYRGKKVLEIGPGSTPFPIATHFVDHQRINQNTVVIDIDTTPLPYSDKEFDFVYCRHTLEDIQNPVFAFNEIVRVAKSGYIETPSPIVELTRGIDGSSPFYKGYIHHRSVVWEHDGILNFIGKYPVVEYTNIHVPNELLKDPYMWNSYYLWDEHTTPRCMYHKHDIHYDLHTNYADILVKALNQSHGNIVKFKQVILG